MLQIASERPDYDAFAEAIRQLLLKRLTSRSGGPRFAVLTLTALVRDDKLAELLFGEPDN